MNQPTTEIPKARPGPLAEIVLSEPDVTTPLIVFKARVADRDIGKGLDIVLRDEEGAVARFSVHERRSGGPGSRYVLNVVERKDGSRGLREIVVNDWDTRKRKLDRAVGSWR